MAGNKVQLYKLAKYTNLEIVLESQIQSSGANQARLMERYKKSKNSIKSQVIAMRFAYGFIFGMTSLLPIINYFQLRDLIDNPLIAPEGILVAGSLIFSLFFGMQLVYVTFMGMFSIGAMMTGGVFQWYETLPLSKDRLQKLGFLTVLRNLDLAFIMMVFSFPIIIAIISQSFLLTITSGFISFFQGIFGFSVLVLIAGKVGHILQVESSGSKKSTLLRIITMLIYVIVVMTASLFIQWAVTAMGSFIFMISAMEIPSILVFFLGLIPYPFAPSLLMTMLMNPIRFESLQWVSIMIGMILFIALTLILYKKAISSMKSITTSSSLELRQDREEIAVKIEDLSIKTISPIKSYIKKDLSTSTRDIQMFMFLLMPLILPLLIVLVFAVIPSEEFGDIQIHLISMWSLIMFYQPLISLMIITGFLNVEDSGVSITASLPLNPREQAKAKLTLLFIIQSLSFFIPVIIITIINPVFMPYIPLFLSWYPIALIFLLNGFTMKIRMFGRMKYKFVLEEVNPERKVLKWILLIVIQFGLYIFYVIAGALLLLFTNIILMTSILVISSLIIISLLMLSLQNMFPKEFGKKQMVSIRESFQKKPILGTCVVLIVYAGFLFLPGIIELPLIFIIDVIPYTLLLFIDFSINFGIMAFLWFYVIPRVLHLPAKTYSFKEYLDAIKFNTKGRLTRNIFLGLGCSAIFFLSSFIASNLFGTYVFDLEVIFGNPSLNPFRLGWFYFIIMLIPGIWEEVSFRGVITTLNLKKYSKFNSILISSLFFGLYHFLNLLAGQSLLPTAIQVAFASYLGGLFGYMYLKTKSLIPCIITHYLIDAVGQLFLNTYFNNLASYYLFGLLGIGLIPMIFGMLFTKLVVNKSET